MNDYTILGLLTFVCVVLYYALSKLLKQKTTWSELLRVLVSGLVSLVILFFIIKNTSVGGVLNEEILTGTPNF
jgi:hypothetical protein